MNSTTNSRSIFGVSAALLAMALCSTLGHAQATRTWVSGVGDDANPCSRTAPCKTWAGAISKTAAGGEIDALDPGGFGAVTITKAITLDGGAGLASILAVGTNAINISAGANDAVTIRNLSINLLGASGSPGFTGIKINSAIEVNIENCTIFEGSQMGVDIAPAAPATACHVNIKNSVIRGFAQGAVHAHPTSIPALVTITKSHLNASLFGFKGEDRSTATIDDTDASGNTNNGIIGVAASAPVLISANNCVSSNNGAFGVVSTGSQSTVRISNCTISANGTGVATTNIGAGSGVLVSFGNNRIKGNTADTSAAPTSTISQQ